jgi:spore coat polysaccharide biosynthesis protein SpsF
MPVTAIIQARMTSGRLPGKVLMEVLGRPMLAYQVERVARAETVDRIVIATTVNESDDPVARFAGRAGIGLFRGSESDVLGRMAGAAEAEGASVVVRLTGDCPILDPALLDRVVDRLRDTNSPTDYVTCGMPRTWPIGLDVEAMTADVLRVADREATDPYDREHVTPYLYRHPERFKIAAVTSPVDLSHHRWTLDEAADFELIRRILESLWPTNPAFGLEDVLGALDRHPEWRWINAGTVQKTRRYEYAAASGLQSTTKEDVGGE